MTEFIPRDIPVYCFWDKENEIDKNRALTTQDVFRERWGLWNVIPQRRITRVQDAMGVLYGFNNKLLSNIGFTLSTRQFIRLFQLLDLVRIFHKIRALDTPVVIVYAGTTLKYDIPARYMDNDISFFKMAPNNVAPDQRAGFMVSPAYAKSAYSFFMKEVFADDYQLFDFFKQDEKERFYSVENILRAMPNCKHNIDELINMTNEESFGAFV